MVFPSSDNLKMVYTVDNLGCAEPHRISYILRTFILHMAWIFKSGCSRFMVAASKCYYLLLKRLRYSLLLRKTNVTRYKTLIRPVLLYASETWRLIKDEEGLLSKCSWKEILKNSGKPKARWIDALDNDMRKVGVKIWKMEAKNSDGWRRILEENKAHL
jgi:hypothetical protein